MNSIAKYQIFTVAILLSVMLFLLRRQDNFHKSKSYFLLKKALITYRNELFSSTYDTDLDYKVEHKVTVFKWHRKANCKWYEFNKYKGGKQIDVKGVAEQLKGSKKPKHKKTIKFNKASGWLHAIARSNSDTSERSIKSFVYSKKNPRLFKGFVGHIMKTNYSGVFRFNRNFNNIAPNYLQKYAEDTYNDIKDVRGLLNSGDNIPKSMAGFRITASDGSQYVLIIDSIYAKGVPDDFMLKHPKNIKTIENILESI